MTEKVSPWFCARCEPFALTTSILVGEVDPTKCALCYAARGSSTANADARPSCPTIFVGCACYRTITPETASSREALLWGEIERARVEEPHHRDRGLRVHDFELVGSGNAEGYGAPRNFEALCDAAIKVDADLFLYHDADVRFSEDDVASLVDRWKALGPRCLVGALYPDSRGGDDLVGRLVGVDLGPDRRESTPRSVAAALGTKAVEAESLGFGFVLIPVDLIRELRETRGFAIGESSQGHVVTTGDSEFCGAAKRLGWTLVADLRARPEHCQRVWGSA